MLLVYTVMCFIAVSYFIILIYYWMNTGKISIWTQKPSISRSCIFKRNSMGQSYFPYINLCKRAYRSIYQILWWCWSYKYFSQIFLNWYNKIITPHSSPKMQILLLAFHYRDLTVLPSGRVTVLNIKVKSVTPRAKTCVS